VPVIGSIPVYNPTRSRFRHFGQSERTLVPASSAASQAYHTLATSLRFSSLGKEKRTILVTSSTGGEGKTTVTANLAAVLAESGLKVVVVSADLRRPMLGGMFGVEDRDQGLTSAMLGDIELSSSCFVSVPLPSGRSIFVLPAGPLPHEPSVLLGSDMFGTILDQIKQAGADFILVDCAPVLPVSDPLAAARHVDGVIVLSLYGKTKTTNLSTTIERLRQVDAEIMGVVVNGIPATGGYGGYYGYGSNYSSYASTVAPPPPKGTPPADTNGAANGAANGKAPAGVGPGATSGSARREHDPDFL
jgi:capsular exopolysaccharide synthesis family protein